MDHIQKSFQNTFESRYKHASLHGSKKRASFTATLECCVLGPLENKKEKWHTMHVFMFLYIYHSLFDVSLQKEMNAKYVY